MVGMRYPIPPQLAIFERIKKRLPWQKIIPIIAVVFLIGFISLTPDGLMGKADAVGYAVCHRIDARSFHLGDRQIPVCARCTGQYFGAMLGLFYLSIYRPRRTGRPPWAIIGVLIFFAAAYGLDGANSYLHLIPDLSRFYLYEPSNQLRLFTGTGLGLGISVMLYPAFNETIWKERDPRPVFDGIRDFGVLLVIGAAVDLLILTENPLLLYPMALVSAAGVLVLLTMVYSMVLAMIFKVENRYQRLSSIVVHLVSGFIIALMQVSILDYVRFLMTGSWSGFHFG
jgi:uncharacterized membrane protein